MAKKKAKKKLGALYQPAQHLSGRTLRSAAQALTDLEFAPQERALKSMAANATAQGTKLASNAGDYYTQMAESEKTRLDRQSALRGMVNTRTAAVGADVQAANTAATDQEKARLAQDTLFRGNMGQSDVVLSELAALGARSQAKQSQAASLADAQGANYEDLAAAMASARQLRGGEVQDRLLNRMANERTKIRDQRAGLAADKGNARTKNLLTLRQSSFENALTQKELGIKQKDLQATMDNMAADNAQAQQKMAEERAWRAAQLDIKRGVDPITGRRLPKSKSSADALNDWKLNYAKKHGHLPSTGAPKPPKKEKRTGLQMGAAQDTIGSARTIAQTLKAKGFPRQKIAQALVTGAGVDKVPELWASIALDLAFDGHVSAANRTKLKRRGYDIKKMGLPTKVGAASAFAGARGTGTARISGG